MTAAVGVMIAALAPAANPFIAEATDPKLQSRVRQRKRTDEILSARGVQPLMVKMILFAALLLAAPAHAEWGTICDPNEWRLNPKWCASRPGAKMMEFKPPKKIDKEIAAKCREKMTNPELTDKERKVLEDCANYHYEGH